MNGGHTRYTDDGAATALGYDVHGNVQTRTTGAEVTTYTWDPRGPLASVQRPGSADLIEYVLDPAGRRIGRKVGGALERGWLYAGGLLPVAETDADGSTVRRVFVYATRALHASSTDRDLTPRAARGPADPSPEGERGSTC